MGAELERLAGLLPPAAVEVAAEWRPWPTDRPTLLRELLLPLVVEADWPGPANPLPVGDGWVQPDVTEDDLDTLDRLRQHLSETEPGYGAERLATVAQEWRLPVVPYRVAPTLPPSPPPPLPRRPIMRTDAKVLDLSSLWAGPLCTRLLSEAGARVTKLDADCRPDGFRERPNLYAELNEGKTIVDLDLRESADRARFEQLVAEADLLVESFTRRVLSNLGYDNDQLSRLNPGLVRLSIVGFGTSTVEADWLTYGSGIHAISGLGVAGGRAVAAAVAYPDPLTGYRAAGVAVEALDSRERSQAGVIHHEVALADAGYEVARRTPSLVSPGGDP